MYYKRFEITAEQARDNAVIDFGEVFNAFLIVRNDIPLSYRINLINQDIIHSDEMQGFENEGTIRRLFITHAATTATDKIVILVYK